MKNTISESMSTAEQARKKVTIDELHDKCMSLATNLWWSWTPEAKSLFRDLDPIRWRQTDHNPIALLSEFTPDRLYKRANEMVLLTRINQAYRRQKEYMNSRKTWSTTNAGVLGRGPLLISRPNSGSTNRCPSIQAAWVCSPATTSRARAVWVCRSSR